MTNVSIPTKSNAARAIVINPVDNALKNPIVFERAINIPKSGKRVIVNEITERKNTILVAKSPSVLSKSCTLLQSRVRVFFTNARKQFGEIILE